MLGVFVASLMLLLSVIHFYWALIPKACHLQKSFLILQVSLLSIQSA